MPISFRCEKCDQLLRVPDDAAGKKAKCPSCSEVASVPMESTEPPQPAAPMPPPSAGDAFRDPSPANPYSTPTVDRRTLASAVSCPLSHRTIDVGEVINVSWEIFKNNMSSLVVAFLVFMVISMLLGGLTQVIMMTILGAQQQGPVGQQPFDPAALSVSMVLNIVSSAVQAFFMIGMARMYLVAARGGSPEIGLLFSGGDKFVPIFLASIVFGIAVGLGSMLCVIPGIILACGLWMHYYLILDQDVAIMDSFSQAWEFSKGNRLSAVLLFLVQIGLAIIGLLLLCVGLLFTSPLGGLMWAVAYLQITGQPVGQSDPA